ncbi:MAG: 50S ribosomal protein L15e [Candidatus Micrarchaeota archaeon]
MGMYDHIRRTFEREYKERSEVYRHRLSKWRGENSVVKLERPTNLTRARTLGWKAKQGYIIVRVRTGRGQRKRPKPMGGRKPGKNIRYLSPGVSSRKMAEQRAGRKYRNMEVLNSYWVGEDGQKKYFEIILVDPKYYKGKISKTRIFRGLTSASRKGRGMRK